ncbi:MAG TPA: hypothetical protein VKG44_00560 [Candidatus Baltobacteraceae bacterium]|nr:hypothetical protein [Candidatus Baltobacteraceae bacterium]
MAKLITGLFHDRFSAERAVDELERIGYPRSEISVLMDDAARTRVFASDTNTQMAANVGLGATFGGALGAIIAGVTATGAIVASGGIAIPFVAGPLAAMLAGAGAGGLAGGIVGALASVGIPEDRVEIYREGLAAGGIMVAVTARDGDEVRVGLILQNEPLPPLTTSKTTLDAAPSTPVVAQPATTVVTSPDSTVTIPASEVQRV